MAQREIEVILARQLAAYLAMPIFIVDPDGTLMYYNEPAEQILGYRFDETGAMPVDEWTRRFSPVDQNHQPVPPDDLPLVIALRDRRPAHSRFWIQGLDNVYRHIEVAALPLIGQGDRFLGGMAIFWEVAEP